MSIIPTLFAGLEGSSEVVPHALVPSTGFSSKPEANHDPFLYGAYTEAPELFNAAIDYSTRRVVLPCKGITHHVLRRPPVPSVGGMLAPTGIGRHQAKGLAYSPEKPIDLPIMPLSDPNSSGLNNKLGQPL